MTPGQIVNIIVFFLTPLGVILAIHIEKHFALRLPQARTTLLDRFAMQSVKKIERLFPDSITKRALIEANVAELFEAYKVPPPPLADIDTAIEAAFYDLAVKVKE